MQVHASLTSLSNNRLKLQYTECHIKEGHGMSFWGFPAYKTALYKSQLESAKNE